MTIGQELFVLFVGSGVLAIVITALTDCWRGK